MGICYNAEMPDARERLIVALDVPSARAALDLADALGDVVSFYKVGLELFAAGEARAVLGELKKRDCRVFCDMKLYDVPETVARATAQIAESGADFLTVHGDDAIMRAAAAAKGGHLKILAITVLTSLDDDDLSAMGFARGAEELAAQRARRAFVCGCDGVVASGREVQQLRAAAGDKGIIVIPGVRPAAYRTSDDQKRTATPAQIIGDGGDYLVVGRPIRDAKDPRAAAHEIIAEIAAAQ